jgi:two-component system, OmpR family, response regulator
MSKRNKKIRIFSALEVANICGVVNQTAINWIKNGYLKAFTTPGGQYRVYAENLVEFLQSRGMRIPDELTEIAEKAEGEKSVLVVDDDEDLNNILKNFLEKKMPDISVFQAFDGFEAGIIIAERRPAYIILDIDLPGIDGHKLCKKIKSDPTLNNPVVISITGLDDTRVRVAVLKEGADAFFNKPLDFEQLLQFIQEKEQEV